MLRNFISICNHNVLPAYQKTHLAYFFTQQFAYRGAQNYKFSLGFVVFWRTQFLELTDIQLFFTALIRSVLEKICHLFRCLGLNYRPFLISGLGTLSCSRRLFFHHLKIEHLFWLQSFLVVTVLFQRKRWRIGMTLLSSVLRHNDGSCVKKVTRFTVGAKSI